ncbi:MAG: phosphoglucomutase/phosphomannomutase family protein [Erysipelothrix sp.]|nr:phosphoglucomutase/phosphomannomutase family protein [Erysipelothrix sp.]
MIKFGTGGWRAVIGDAFTKENIQKVATAIALECEDKRIVIGYDRRFLSDVAAQWVSEVMIAHDIQVYFINKAVPTPMIMYSVKQLKTAYGIAITASHNPAIYNGMKIFTLGGKDATEDYTEKFEQTLEKGVEVKTLSFDEGLNQQTITYFDPSNDYIDSILSMVDISAIRKAKLRALLDPMFGVSKTSLSIILSTARVDLDIINSRHDTLFGGKLPSPASSTLLHLSEKVAKEHYDIGIATDGDADRIGIVDEKGVFIHPNVLLCLIYDYLLRFKNEKGPVVRNLSTTHCLDAIAKAHNEACYETAVGFKFITMNMEQHNALIGGESSGGLTIRGHINGKDGIFAAALLVEMLGITQKPLSALVKDLEDRYGKFYFIEKNFAFSQDKKLEVQKKLSENLNLHFEKPIKEIKDFDGIKFYFEEGGWISCRFSGTEPLLRIFAESQDESFIENSVNTLVHMLGIQNDLQA